MKRTNIASSALLALVGTCVTAATGIAGPYPAFTDVANQVQPSQVKAWASTVVDYSPAPGVDAAYADPTVALGANGSGIVSLGDLDAGQIDTGVQPGSITLQFALPIVDKAGPDLAVFENAAEYFTAPYIFGELAYVEVSSNGTDFARFPSVSLNIEPDDNGELDTDEIAVPFGRNFAGVDTTNIHNLAGVHPAGIGTPFDLAELITQPEVVSGAVDLSAIQFVRLVDIPGNGAFLDSLGNPILDTWLTTGSGGLDLDAVGALNVPEPASMVLALAGIATLAWCRRRS
ncbi:PEP-CTERM sorting domain-containing protein [Aeoliella sp. ICT_H6.2]|uniref:PEP-CTERM sorting domain-containing protein n=1 Tax=Aeoliella straminimaris TaxID=2954799 RepID=A0A9X2FCR3_9BACT|nr:PEP-CTERM sorting domain-containing protein [Aeoliella straminimaris]MCO6045783.1 PEP-CTERM sorting domain-containing protein [Aeoliella straminimaris]